VRDSPAAILFDINGNPIGVSGSMPLPVGALGTLAAGVDSNGTVQYLHVSTDGKMLISGTVDIGVVPQFQISNFPAVQAVSGGVVVQNWPAIHGISASVPLQVWTVGPVGVSGTVTLGSQVSVNNFPATQNVSGTVNLGSQVSINNFPAIQAVSGGVVVQNWPAVHGVSASVPFQVWTSGPVGVSGTVTLGSQVSVNNFPAIQNVSGTVNLGSQVSVNNFPAIQAVSGTVSANVQGFVGAIPIQIWSAGTIGVSGTFTSTPGVTQTAQNVSSSSGVRVWNDQPVAMSGSQLTGSIFNGYPVTIGGVYLPVSSTQYSVRGVAVDNDGTYYVKNSYDGMASGRRIQCVFTATGVAGNSTESLISLTPIRNNVVGGAATSHGVSPGKVLRFTQLILTVRNTAATNMGCIIRVRMTNGAVSATSQVYFSAAATNKAATAGFAETIVINFIDGFEISSPTQFGITQLCSSTTGQLDVALIGIEY
jgi:hypothetical protein